MFGMIRLTIVCHYIRVRIAGIHFRKWWQRQIGSLNRFYWRVRARIEKRTEWHLLDPLVHPKHGYTYPGAFAFINERVCRDYLGLRMRSTSEDASRFIERHFERSVFGLSGPMKILYEEPRWSLEPVRAQCVDRPDVMFWLVPSDVTAEPFYRPGDLPA